MVMDDKTISPVSIVHTSTFSSKSQRLSCLKIRWLLYISAKNFSTVLCDHHQVCGRRKKQIICLDLAKNCEALPQTV